jgi:hypothetical protein
LTFPRGRDASPTLVSVSRLLLDIAFVKLAVQVGKAALFRAEGPRRGEDVVYLLDRMMKVFEEERPGASG